MHQEGSKSAIGEVLGIAPRHSNYPGGMPSHHGVSTRVYQNWGSADQSRAEQK